MRRIVAATEENKEEILKLYKIQLGREFCPWDDSYPGMKEIEFDLGRESLFVMIDGQEINTDAGSKEDRIIAAISIDDDPQVERLDCWSHKLAPRAELSRLAVHPDFQNQKIARQMLVFGMEELARRGYKSVHFLLGGRWVHLFISSVFFFAQNDSDFIIAQGGRKGKRYALCALYRERWVW